MENLEMTTCWQGVCDRLGAKSTLVDNVKQLYNLNVTRNILEGTIKTSQQCFTDTLQLCEKIVKRMPKWGKDCGSVLHTCIRYQFDLHIYVMQS